MVTDSRTCLGALCERLRAAKHNAASALRMNEVYVCGENASRIRACGMFFVRMDRAAYMNKGGTAENIGPCDEGWIVPAVFYSTGNSVPVK